MFTSRAPSKSREIDSMSPAGRFNSMRGTVPDRGAQAPVSPALYNCLPIPAKYWASILFRRFFALVGRPARVRRRSRPAPGSGEPCPLSLY